MRLRNETVWLSQRLFADLFEKNVCIINEHIQNIFQEGELEREATIRNFHIVQNRGSRQIGRDVELYNLDVIISIGCHIHHRFSTEHRQPARGEQVI